MIVSIIDPIKATWIFSAVLFLAVAISARTRQITEWFPTTLTTELKGLSILMIVLSHIGYFLVSDTRFLWPLSIMAGVGVNLFLFLSGYGLTASQLQKELRPVQFYWRRLLKIFTPFWLMFLAIAALDVFVLKISYTWDYLAPIFFGVIRHADLYQDFNSPLWYLTFIIGYYLLFPLVFSKKRPWLTAAILFLAGYAFVFFEPSAFNAVIHLYRVHYAAFPLGILAAWLIGRAPKPSLNLDRYYEGRRTIFSYGVLVLLFAIFVYANYNSGVGASPYHEQMMSLVAVAAICGFFVLKRIEFRLFFWIGVYSYEIYLWHWPLMYRYDIFFRFMPAGYEWLATLLYLALFIGVGWLSGKVLTLVFPAKKLTAPKLKTA